MDKFTAQMTGFDKLFNRILTKVLRYRDIVKGSTDREILYLRRFYLKRTGKKRYFLHYFVRSDNDRWLHDHPWDAEVIILNKGYREEVKGGKFIDHTKWKKRSLSAEWFHRVHLCYGPVWTIFMPQQKRKQWGFLVGETWEPHYKYLKNEGELDVY